MTDHAEIIAQAGEHAKNESHPDDESSDLNSERSMDDKDVAWMG